MKWLIGCEESQVVCKALRKLGEEAFSNDIIDCSGGHPEWHLKMDIFEATKMGGWDVLIAFPPCTYLTVSGNRHFINNPDRWRKRLYAMMFVYDIMNCGIKHIAIENPIGAISSHIRPPEQIIHPYYFGDPVPKKTGLWLQNLPPLQYSIEDNLFGKKTMVEPEYVIYKSKKNKSGFSRYGVQGKIPSTNNPENARLRSKTYPGIAKAMAEQWTSYLKNLQIP